MPLSLWLIIGLLGMVAMGWFLIVLVAFEIERIEAGDDLDDDLI